MPSLIPGKLKFILIAVAILILFGIGIIVASALGQKPTTNPNTPITLQVWGFDDEAVYKQVFDVFTKIHPQVTIQYSRQTQSHYYDRLVNRKTAGTFPDLFLYHNTWVPEVKSILTPLPPSILTPTNFKQIFYPAALSDLVLKDGSIVGLPQSDDGLVIYASQDLLTTAAVTSAEITTWENFYTETTRLTQKDPLGAMQVAGAAIGSSKNVTYFSDIIGLMYVQQDINHLSQLGQSQNDNDILNFYARFASGLNNVWDPTLGNDVGVFTGGKTAMIFGTSQTIGSINAQNNKMHVAVYPVPQLDLGQPKNWATYWVWGVHALSPQKDLAWQLAWLLDNKSSLLRENTVRKNLNTPQLPYPRTDMATYQAQDPILSVFNAEAKTAKSFYFANQTQDVESSGNGIDATNIAILDTAITGLVAGHNVDLKAVAGKILDNLSSYGVNLPFK